MRHFKAPRGVVLTAGAAAVALSLAACSGDPGGEPTGGGAAEASKELLVLGATLDMYGWNPADQPGFQNWAKEALWDALIFCDENGQPKPAIAESWEVTNDNRTFTAKLREGLTFHDGTALDAADVQTSFEFRQENGGAAADYAGTTFETPDDLTISITWPEPQPVLFNKICNATIQPSEYLEAASWDVPVGSGPYEYDGENTVTGSVYAFTKNEDHWNADGYPYERLEIRVIESDAAAVSALTTGQIHASLIDIGSVEQAEGQGLEVIQFQGQTARLIISDRHGNVEPALGDVRVRQAMNMVLDKDAIAQRLYQGYAEPTAQTFRPGSAAYIEDLEDPYPYDIEGAQALMAEAGYEDGFALELPTMEGQNHETLLPYVAQQLAEINIEVTEVPLSGANAIGDLLSGEYPVVLWQLGNFGDSALQIYIENTADGWWNLQHEKHEYVDTRWEQMATATPEESAELQKEINQYIIDEAWYAPFVLHGTMFAYNPEKVDIPTQSDDEALTPLLRDFQ
jgi:peptide/nickel transport system substrate-binding protein